MIAHVEHIESDHGGQTTPTTWDSLRWRFDQAGNRGQPDMPIEPGCLADYRTLARFHYRGGFPGAVTSVLRMVHRGRSVIDRFRDSLGAWSRHRQPEARVVGVLVRSLPALACGLRDLATGGRYAGLDQRDAAVLLNREVRTISRVIIHPQWRGLGLAVKLVRGALAEPEPGVVFTEALAAMGRVCPFFERAGMIRFDRPLHGRMHDARLIDALESARGANDPPTDSSEHERLTRTVWALAHQPLDARTSKFVLRELRRWHQAAHRVPRRILQDMSIRQLLHSAANHLLASPAFYLHQHAAIP